MTPEIHDVGAGRLCLEGRPWAIFRWIDAELEAMAVRDGASPIQVPALIDREVLDRAGFFDAFGEMATRVAANGGAREYVLSPALCYHAYASLANRQLDAPIMLTTVGRCYRREAKPSPTRLWEFTMREVIFIGTADWVADERARWLRRVSRFAQRIGLTSRVELATDPFFVAAARGKKLIQQLKELKYELQMRINTDEAEVAVASMNLHETFFGSRFGLTLPDGSPAWSACVAFGLERWTLAMIAQLGVERATEIVATCSTTNT